jgi:oligopeptide/dipeptide ABC transporter ATP-binding protein
VSSTEPIAGQSAASAATPVAAVTAEAPLPASTLRAFWQFLRGRPLALAGLVAFALLLLIAALAPVVAPHPPLEQHLGDNFKPPVWKDGGIWEYPLGTDPLGRDLLSRLIYGARYSLFISIASVILGGALGFIVGLISGYFGRWTDTVLMRLGDIQLAFPFVLFAIAILAVSPNRTSWKIVLVLGLSSWIIYARVVRSRVLTEREKNYAWAARALGASRWRVLFRYIVPNVWQSVPLIGMLNLGFFVIVESLLSFLSLGLSPPTPSWGAILSDGRQYMLITPWMAIFPGAAIILTVLSINLAADGLADYFDPKLRYGAFRRRPLATPAAPTAQATASAPLLSVRDLTTVFPTGGATVHAVKRVSFDLPRGQVLGVVGESGSGKSTLGLSIIQLLDAPGQVTAGEIVLQGRDLARVSNEEMGTIRGAKIGMIFQDPGASLNPVLTVGSQLRETLRRHRRLAPSPAQAAAREGLVTVGIADPDRVLRAYPFQLSGGMQQRVMIALAMASEPDLLILDEPTSALDVTTQAQLLDELESVRTRSGTSIVFITHDIALLSDFADSILVMYAGQLCEIGPRDEIVERPRHPYTQALIGAVERRHAPGTNRLVAIPGDPPDPTRLSPGCPFAPRCPFAMPICNEVNPVPVTIGEGHAAACHLVSPHPLPPLPTAGEGRIGPLHVLSPVLRPPTEPRSPLPSEGEGPGVRADG